MPRNAQEPLIHVNSPIIFIGGHSRSGTTLMHGLICKSNDTIRMTTESSYLRGLVEAFERSNRVYKFHTFDYFDTYDEFVDLHKQITEKYLEHVGHRFGLRKILVQKDPKMTPFFPEISLLMPNARFVVMVRDFRDVITSQVIRLARLGRKVNVDAQIKRFVSMHERLLGHRQILNNKLLYVRYERLVYYPNETLNEVAHFLKISFSDNIAETTWPTRRRPRDESATPLEGQPLSKSRVGAYRTALDTKTVEKLEKMMPEISEKINMDCFAADHPEDARRFPNTELLT